MAYDKKLLAAARRELERERTAHTEELEARRHDIYTREPRIRAIDRELSASRRATPSCSRSSFPRCCRLPTRTFPSST